MKQPDTDWALLALAGTDQNAVRTLFECHRRFVFRVAWGLLNEEQTAEDVVQDVFFQMASGRLRAKPKARFTTWLYQVSLNTAKAHSRARRRVWGDANAAQALEHQADATTGSHRIDTLTDLGNALATLPLRQREVVVLRYLEGCDTAETAAILGCRAGTVKAHLHRATQALKSTLTPPKETAS